VELPKLDLAGLKLEHFVDEEVNEEWIREALSRSQAESENGVVLPAVTGT
jgi:hypothetical protein